MDKVMIIKVGYTTQHHIPRNIFHSGEDSPHTKKIDNICISMADPQSSATSALHQWMWMEYTSTLTNNCTSSTGHKSTDRSDKSKRCLIEQTLQNSANCGRRHQRPPKPSKVVVDTIDWLLPPNKLTLCEVALPSIKA